MAWGEFVHILEHMAILILLSVFGEALVANLSLFRGRKYEESWRSNLFSIEVKEFENKAK